MMNFGESFVAIVVGFLGGFWIANIVVVRKGLSAGCLLNSWR